MIQTKKELTISAAASLQDALTDIKGAFEKQHSDMKINYKFGASGVLQKQISQGAPVDLFFSAAEDTYNELVDEGLIEKANGTDLVGNELVVVVPRNSNKGIQSFEDLTKTNKIYIGTPETVPAGRYAKETLTNLQLWNAIEEKVDYAKDVRHVLSYVESGNSDAGIVYKTDALISSSVEIVATAKENTHSPIIYPVGMIKKSSHSKEAQVFYDYLQNEKSMKTFEKFGFTVLNEKHSNKLLVTN